VSDDYARLLDAHRDLRDIWSFDHPMWIRPLTDTSWWAVVQIAGNDFHAQLTLNLLLHWANSLLVLAISRQLLKGRQKAFAAALVFAVFPLHSEAVSWLSGRVDLLCTFFYLCAFYFYLAARFRDRRVLLLVSLAFWIAALLSKEMALSFPFLIAAFETFVFARIRLSRPLASVRSSPFTVLCLLLFAGYLLLRVELMTGLGGYGGGVHHHLHWKSLELLIHPILPLSYPVNFAVVHDGPWALQLSMGIGLATSYLLLGWGQKVGALRKGGFTLLCIYLLMLPVVNLSYIDTNLQNSRFLYLPSAAFAVGIAWVTQLTKRRAQAGVVIYLLTLTSLQYLHNTPWGEAGLTSRQIVYAIANTPTHHKEITGIPDSHRGAYVLRNGIPQALRLLYGRQERVCWRAASAPVKRVSGRCAARRIRYHWDGRELVPEDVGAQE
jgi:hypothetical protein